MILSEVILSEVILSEGILTEGILSGWDSVRLPDANGACVCARLIDA